MRKFLKILLSSVFLILISGCQMDPQPPQKPIVDPTLPQVSNIKSISDMTQIGFEWSPLTDPRVQGYYIYRSNPATQSQKLERIATLEDKYSSHFVDTKLIPSSEYFYRFSSYSSDLRESNPSDTFAIKTQPLIEPVAFVAAIGGLPNKIKLIWRPHASSRVVAYLIERNEFSSKEWKQIAKVNSRLNVEYIDKDLSENKVFRYRIKAQTYDGITSLPSEIVQAGTKPLPLPINGLNASYDIPKKIVLNWEASDNKDALYYKIYRAINPLLFFSYYVKTKDTTYEDLINENGKSYYYYVTVVDKDGLESNRQEVSIKGSTLAIPEPVYITASNHDTRSISLAWNNQDQRAVRYTLLKEYSKDGSTKKEMITGLGVASYIDTSVQAGVEYKYNVLAIDKYGLSSVASEDVIVSIPKQ